MAIEDQIREIKTESSQKQARITRAQVELESAERRREEAAQTLAGFGVTNSDQAREKLTELQSALNQAVADAEAALKESGA